MNSTYKCRGCKDRFKAPCKIVINGGTYHSFDCATSYANEKGKKLRAKKEKTEKKQDLERKREFKLNDLRTRRRAVKEACHRYIRMRDKDEPCICCGQPLKPDFHAGHFLESGNNPKVRYNEDNIHGQNLNCNYYKGGSGDYEKNLRAKIGDTRVNFLIAKKGGTVKRTGPELKEIEIYYKQLIKELEQC